MPVIFVSDIGTSKKFYHEIFDLEVERDLVNILCSRILSLSGKENVQKK